MKQRTWITARLDGGELTLTVLAAVPYGADREAVAAVDVAGETQLTRVRKALEAVLEKTAPEALQQAKTDALHATLVAARHNEPLSTPRPLHSEVEE